ncbi:MAG: GatB/YqeY domain-containing protein [Bacteroidia bacterium]
MSLKDQLAQDLKEAMKTKDQAALRAIRAIKSAILIAETAEGRGDATLDAAEEMQLLTRQAKQRRDSIQQFRDNGRDDLAAKEEEELAIIERYLPAQLSEADLAAELKALIAEMGTVTVKDMGKIMGAATQRLAGRADNKAIAATVKALLA